MMEIAFRIPGKIIVIDDFLEPDAAGKVRRTLAVEQYSAMDTIVLWNQGWFHGGGLGAAWATLSQSYAREKDMIGAELTANCWSSYFNLLFGQAMNDPELTPFLKEGWDRMRVHAQLMGCGAVPVC